MPITQSITVLPTPPSRADPENFDTRADAFLGALPTMQTQMNTWAGQANQTAQEIGIVSEGLLSTTAGANKVPMADANGKIDTAWLKVGTGSGEVAAGTNGVTNGDSHDHNGGDGAQIAYSSLSGLPTLGTAAATASTDYAPAAKGVTNGDSHDHNGGDGAQIAYSSLSGLPTLGTAAATASTDYAPAAKGVTNGDSHDHNGGDGAQIAYSSLSGLPTLGTAAAAATTDFAAASHAHGNISESGAIGSAANLPIITTTGGALTVGAFGTGATNFCAGNDARLSNARTPTAHNQAETTITFTDVTTGNASTTAHGFAPKATAPASGLRSVLAIDNGETVRSDKALFDATNPAALGTASPGTAMTAARRDHVHALPDLGKILQVVAATSTTPVEVTSGTYTDIGLSVTITPRDANSTILLLAAFEVFINNASGGAVGAHTKLLRGSTTIQQRNYTPYIEYPELTSTVSYAVQDSPATASAITYKLQGAVADYVSGKSATFLADSSSGSLIALEVAG